MANVIAVATKIKPTDIIPNYEYKLQDIEVNEEEALKVKGYFQMFLEENFSVLENNTNGMTVDQIGAYIKGAKDAVAFFNLFIDSLNTKETE